MPPAAQIVHRVNGQQNCEIQLRLLFRKRQSQMELPAALNHVFEHLIDRILIFASPGGNFATYLFSKAVQEGSGARFIGVDRSVGKQALQFRIV